MAEVYSKVHAYSVRSNRGFSYSGWDGNHASGTVFNYLTSTNSRLDGFKNPRWRDQVGMRVQAGTPATGTHRYLNAGYAVISGYREDKVTIFPNPPDWKRSGYISFGNIWPYSGIPTAAMTNSERTSLTTKARLDFLKNCYELSTSAALGASLLEAREVVRFLKHPMASMIKLLEGREIKLHSKFARKNRVTTSGRRRRNFGDYQDALSDTWLETQFAIKPLISDVVAAAEHLRDRWEHMEVEFVPVKGKAKIEWTEAMPPLYLDIGASSVRRKFIETRKTTKSVRYQGLLRLDPMKGNWSYGDMSRLGLGIRSFIPSIYEATPWSFLLDYFFDVGGLIQSFSFPLSFLRFTTVTIRTECETVIDDALIWAVDPPFGNVLRWGPTSASVLPSRGVYKTWERQVPDPMVLPRVNVPFTVPNPKQITNMVALAASRSRQRFSRL